jgi:hypothetical protein
MVCARPGVAVPRALTTSITQLRTPMRIAEDRSVRIFLIPPPHSDCCGNSTQRILTMAIDNQLLSTKRPSSIVRTDSGRRAGRAHWGAVDTGRQLLFASPSGVFSKGAALAELATKDVGAVNLNGQRKRVPAACRLAISTSSWLLLWHANHANSDLPPYRVGIFLTRLLRQLFGLERLRQNDKFKTFVFEEQASHRSFHSCLSQFLKYRVETIHGKYHFDFVSSTSILDGTL